MGGNAPPPGSGENRRESRGDWLMGLGTFGVRGLCAQSLWLGRGAGGVEAAWIADGMLAAMASFSYIA